MRRIERPLEDSTGYNYWLFCETNLSRKLQRYCVEQAFRVFVNPHSNPRTVYQLFRLLPAMREKTVMRACFEGLLHAGANKSLENTFLPFYCIGGAGTHYPVMDDQGNPLYPWEMRLPRRILGLLPIPNQPKMITSNILKPSDLGASGSTAEMWKGFSWNVGLMLKDLLHSRRYTILPSTLQGDLPSISPKI